MKRMNLLEKRIFPAQSRKAREIAVGGAQDQAVFDGECGKVRIRYEVGLHAGRCEEPAEYFAVPLGGLGNPGPFAAKPVDMMSKLWCIE